MRRRYLERAGVVVVTLAFGFESEDLPNLVVGFWNVEDVDWFLFLLSIPLYETYQALVILYYVDRSKCAVAILNGLEWW
jgi:hypothetical protein